MEEIKEFVQSEDQKHKAQQIPRDRADNLHQDSPWVLLERAPAYGASLWEQGNCYMLAADGHNLTVDSNHSAQG
jgi:hypothetical protein